MRTSTSLVFSLLVFSMSCSTDLYSRDAHAPGVSTYDLLVPGMGVVTQNTEPFLPVDESGNPVPGIPAAAAVNDEGDEDLLAVLNALLAMDPQPSAPASVPGMGLALDL